MTGRWVKSSMQHNATSPPRRKMWCWLIMCNVSLPCTHTLTHLPQLFRIHKEFQFPTQDTWEISNYTTEKWLRGVVMDWMVTLWNTLLETVSWMPSVTHCSKEILQQQVAWLYAVNGAQPHCVCFCTQSERIQRERTRTGTRAKDKGITLPKKCLQSWYWTPLLRLLFISCQPSWHAHLALGT